MPVPGMDQLQAIIAMLSQLMDWLRPFVHLNLLVKVVLDDSLGLLLKVWFGLILHTTDFETGHDFTTNSTIQAFEPTMQLVADGALTLVAIWASYRVMWGHGLRSQFTARIMLPRLMMSAVLINFSLPLVQALVQASNAACDAIQSFGTLPDWQNWLQNLMWDPSSGPLQIVATAVLVVGYDILGIAYLIRYTILIVLAITAPLAGLLFTLPETHHLAKQWGSLFMTNLLMQPIQLFVLAIGFALERNGHTPVHHVFALAALLVVFKVPGAMGGAEKVAHKLESTLKTGFHALEHAVAR
jgi:ABC-type cobalt transport system substrate-binding protein